MTRRTGVLAAVGLLLSGCSATTALNALISRDTYDVREGIAYGPHPRQQLDVYFPKAQGQAQQPWPVVVFFYGGAWSAGKREDYRFFGEAMASAGIVAVVADYRLSPEVRYPVFVQDSAAAAAWTFAHIGELRGDPKRVYVMGHSSGAYQAAMLALDDRWMKAQGLSPQRFAGFIGLAGPYDFLPIENEDAKVAFEWPSTKPESQPINHVTRAAPRTLLIAANSDSLVNPDRNTNGLAEKLRAAGVDVTVFRHSGVSHVTLMGSIAKPLRFLAPVREEVVAFIGGNAGGTPAK